MSETDITPIHSWLDRPILQVPLDPTRFLDAGCGQGIIGGLMRIYRLARRIVGVDAYEPYLQFCEKLGVYDQLLKHDLRDSKLPFAEREFDVATCVEVLEHKIIPGQWRQFVNHMFIGSQTATRPHQPI
jgi:2-polyprenyl-3-methyl-5-hydroxy-6-metoxy-1,4-benzoquinol methylase